MAGIHLISEVTQQGSSGSGIRIVADDTQKAYAKATTVAKDSAEVAEDADATVQISEEARQKYVELEMLKRETERLRQQREAGEEYAEDMAKVMEIFRRIARGDKVPSTDEKKLMEYSNELYQAAKSAAMLAQNKERKEHKALFEEENEVDRLSQVMMEQGENTAEKPEWTGVSFENVGVVISE